MVVHIMKIVVVVAGIGACVKGGSLLVAPQTTSRLVRWWCERSVTFLRGIGVVLFALGIGCITVAVLSLSDPLIAATLIIGTLLMIAGVLYFIPDALRVILRPWYTGKPAWTRVVGVLALVAGVTLLALAFMVPR